MHNMELPSIGCFVCINFSGFNGFISVQSRVGNELTLKEMNIQTVKHKILHLYHKNKIADMHQYVMEFVNSMFEICLHCEKFTENDARCKDFINKYGIQWHDTRNDDLGLSFVHDRWESGEFLNNDDTKYTFGEIIDILANNTGLFTILDKNKSTQENLQLFLRQSMQLHESIQNNLNHLVQSESVVIDHSTINCNNENDKNMEYGMTLNLNINQQNSNDHDQPQQRLNLTKMTFNLNDWIILLKNYSIYMNKTFEHTYYYKSATNNLISNIKHLGNVMAIVHNAGMSTKFVQPLQNHDQEIDVDVEMDNKVKKNVNNFRYVQLRPDAKNNNNIYCHITACEVNDSFQLCWGDVERDLISSCVKKNVSCMNGLTYLTDIIGVYCAGYGHDLVNIEGIVATKFNCL